MKHGLNTDKGPRFITWSLKLGTSNWCSERMAHSLADSLSFMSSFVTGCAGTECLPGKHSRTFFDFSDEFPKKSLPRRGEGREGPIIRRLHRFRRDSKLER